MEPWVYAPLGRWSALVLSLPLLPLPVVVVVVVVVLVVLSPNVWRFPLALSSCWCLILICNFYLFTVFVYLFVYLVIVFSSFFFSGFFLERFVPHGITSALLILRVPCVRPPLSCLSLFVLFCFCRRARVLFIV